MTRQSLRPRSMPTREYRNHHLDSTRWRGYQPRPGDVVVTTPYKSGTTWMQRIVGSLLLWPEPLTSGARGLSPWIDARFHGPIGPILHEFEAQQHRRYLKSHLAADGVPIWDEVSYIVVGRDTRDVFMSLWNHYSGHTEGFFDLINDPDLPGDPFPRPPEDPRVLWPRWSTRGWFPWEPDGWPYWSHTHHISTWWALRHRPNVLFVHFNDLLADSGGEASIIWRDGTDTFFHKGTNGRWRGVLADADLALYEEGARRLDPGLRSWLEQGRHGHDPHMGT